MPDTATCLCVLEKQCQNLMTYLMTYSDDAYVWVGLRERDQSGCSLRRNSTSSSYQLNPKHFIKFLLLVKTLPKFTLVLPSVSEYFGKSLTFSSLAKHPVPQPVTVATPQTLPIGCAEVCKYIGWQAGWTFYCMQHFYDLVSSTEDIDRRYISMYFDNFK